MFQNFELDSNGVPDELAKLCSIDLVFIDKAAWFTIFVHIQYSYGKP